jgi:hypothetical protein
LLYYGGWLLAQEIDIEIGLMFIGSGIIERQDAQEMDRSSTCYASDPLAVYTADSAQVAASRYTVRCLKMGNYGSLTPCVREAEDEKVIRASKNARLVGLDLGPTNGRLDFLFHSGYLTWEMHQSSMTFQLLHPVHLL